MTKKNTINSNISDDSDEETMISRKRKNVNMSFSTVMQVKKSTMNSSQLDEHWSSTNLNEFINLSLVHQNEQIRRLSKFMPTEAIQEECEDPSPKIRHKTNVDLVISPKVRILIYN